jgi:hypothetical protein
MIITSPKKFKKGGNPKFTKVAESQKKSIVPLELP